MRPYLRIVHFFEISIQCEIGILKNKSGIDLNNIFYFLKLRKSILSNVRLSAIIITWFEISFQCDKIVSDSHPQKRGFKLDEKAQNATNRKMVY